MADEKERKPETPKRREKRRIKKERTGDSPEKQREKRREDYDGNEMVRHAERIGVIGMG